MFFTGFFLLLIALFVLIALIKMVWMGLFSIGFGGFVLLAVALTTLFALHRRENIHHPPRMAHEKMVKPHKHHHRPPHARPLPARPPILPHQFDETKLPPMTTVPDGVLVEPSVVDLQENSIGEQATDMTEIVRDQYGQLIYQRKVSETPDWVRLPRRSVTPQGTTLILHSQRFATVQETRDQLWPVLKSAMINDLSQRYSGIWGWSPTLADVEKSGVLRKECDITYPLQIGNFEESVHQVYWQVQFNDNTRAQLSSSWRPLLVRTRLSQLAAGFFVAMILLSLGAFTLHRRSVLPSST